MNTPFHVRRRPILPTAAFLMLLAAGAARPTAEQVLPPELDEQLARIFTKREYEAPRFGPVRWTDGAAGYTTLERSDQSDSFDLVRYDARSGARSVLVPSARLKPSGSDKPIEIEDYAWSADGCRLLVFTRSQRVWRQNTRGDYWVLDLPSGALHQLGGQAEPASLMFAKFSPDGRSVAYVRGNNLYVENLETSGILALTRDGSETTINGTSDWVYEEELGVRDGFRWSPDGSQIAFWQFDTTDVGIFTLINSTDSLYPVLTRIPYPKAGTRNSAVRIGVVGTGGGAITWIKTPGDPRNTYLATLEWVDPRTLAIQQLNRLQNRNDYLLADTAGGEAKLAFRDESSTWVDVVEDVRWIDRDREFLWVSERDGWRHVYRVPRAGGPPRLVTRFDADILEIVGIDEKGGWLYVTASPDNPAQRYLYRTRLDGNTAPERITPAAFPGTHSYEMSPGGTRAFHTWSRFDQPPVVDVVDLPSHRSLRPLTDTRSLSAALAPILIPPVEFIRLDIGDGVTLDGWMIKPPSFDPARQYPVIVHVYGEPAGQTVVDRWGGNGMLFHRALARAGYVILSMDNRGTPAPRGAQWRKVVYGTVGDLSSKEQAAAVRAAGKRFPFLDTERVGIWGWSGGGSNTLNAMFRFPDVFKVGVSVAPVPDQRLYDTIYQERYMGLPQDNVEGYRIGSPINFAEGLAGRLLIVHGSGDDNVHYQGTERLVNRLVELGKSFDMMVYPNRSHAISEGAGTSLHIYQLVARYFLEHLPPS